MKRLIAILISLLLFTGCAAQGVPVEDYAAVIAERDILKAQLDAEKNRTPEPTATMSPAPSERPTPAVSTAPANGSTNAASRDTAIAIVKNMLVDDANSGVRFDEPSNAIVVTYTVDGSSVCAIGAIAGDANNLKTWNELRAAMQNYAVTLYDLVGTVGYDGNLLLNLGNDISDDKVLMSFLNGVLIYDVVSS